MKRRNFLRLCAVAVTAPAVLVKGGPAIGEAIPVGHFWMQTYGPLYNPDGIDPNWFKYESRLLGIYSGKVILNTKASKCSIGDTIVLCDGRRFRCSEINKDIYKKDLGIYWHETIQKTK